MKTNFKPALSFFSKLAVFLLLVWGVDYAGGKMLDGAYRKIEGNYRDYIINTAEGECFILGASTANHHYNPSMLSNSLGMEVYNAGWDGEGMFHYYALLNAVCERTHPRLIIMDLSPDALLYDAKYYDRLSYFNFWYDRDSTFHSTVGLKSKYESLKMLSRLYRFNSTVDKVLFSSVTGLSMDTDRFPQGYMPLDCKDVLFDGYNANPAAVDPLLTEYLERIIKICREQNIRLVVAMSPQYYPDKTQRSESHDLVLDICEQYGVPIIDNSASEFFLARPQYFIDNVHLCRDGAEAYTVLFQNELRDRNLLDN